VAAIVPAWSLTVYSVVWLGRRTALTQIQRSHHRATTPVEIELLPHHPMLPQSGMGVRWHLGERCRSAQAL